MSGRRDWQLPAGVPPGLWSYFESKATAAGYDQELAGHPLFEVDLRFAARHLGKAARAVDLGCGTGRAAAWLAQQGLEVVAVDLSQAMLQQAARRPLASTPGAVLPVRANLVELDCLPDAEFDLAVCLFSTLGMIRGAGHRRAALGHFRRILRPGGTLILHAHHLWRELWEPGGAVRLAVRAIRAWRVGDQLGDRRYLHPSGAGIFVHSFTWRELRRLLEHSGLAIHDRWVLNERLGHWAEPPRGAGWRATGWLVAARRPPGT